MKKLSINSTLVLSFFSILIFGLTAHAQLADELRPFDFSNGYYKVHGVIAETLLDRKNGADKQSVIDTPTDPTIYRNIRITATLPAYSADGSAIYWNYYATATKASFSADAAGEAAIHIAKSYPLYVFPSSIVRGTERQAALIPVDGAYFDTNKLGIAETILVEFSPYISRSGQKTLAMLAQQNGTSIDGTPIIKTAAELGSLYGQGLVTLRRSETAPYAVAKVIQYPDRGGITPDAFLIYVEQADGQPLNAERHFITQFECFQSGSRACIVSGMDTTDQ